MMANTPKVRIPAATYLQIQQAAECAEYAQMFAESNVTAQQEASRYLLAHTVTLNDQLSASVLPEEVVMGAGEESS